MYWIASSFKITIYSLLKRFDFISFLLDGSSIPGKGSASAALLNNSISFACRINDADKASAFEAEVQAINIGLDIINNQFINNNLPFSDRINIYSDNQATLQVIAKPPLSSSNQSTFIQIFDKLVSLKTSLQFSVSLFWCPAHVGIPENEKVDQLAKNSTEGNPLFNLDQQTRTLSNIQQVLERGLSSTIYQLRVGHSPLNDFLFRINKIESPNCHFCHTPETSATLLHPISRWHSQPQSIIEAD
ncbi:hypothetical protein PGTUg99_017709 [Puccinia graminis f. sp. tritici]|uniref:RNase H type-1 domain-containing protein n=1 Tax=Puccinia graminis f. sp. tritici TaxID=56615 RepID=A0A5B0RSR2_PUCGR|nr:hypothetical protein PGTUg99_017709 [Puccinia graminis f. sp. tritici]